MWVDYSLAETVSGRLICHFTLWFAVAAALVMSLVSERFVVSFFLTSVAAGQFVFRHRSHLSISTSVNLQLPPCSLQEGSKLELYSVVQ